MTKWGAGMTKSGGRNDESGGRRSWQAGLASDTLEALPHSSPPLWIPAFAGMTKCGAGMGRPANRGAGALGRPAWPPMPWKPCHTPHRPSGFRPSPE